MLKNWIFARISYEIFKISQKEFKIFAINFRIFSIFGGLAPCSASLTMTQQRFNHVLIPHVHTQDDDSGSRIPQDPSGKMLETHWILQENTGNDWKLEAVFRSKTARIIPVNSCQNPVFSGRK